MSHLEEKITPMNTKTEGLMTNGSNLILTAFSNQLMVSRADVGRLRAAIPTHWRGELCLVAVFIKCPAIGFLFICCGFGGAICINEGFPDYSGRIPQVLFSFTLCLSLIACIWWFIGCLRKTNSLLSSNRFISAAFVYVGSIYVAANALDVLCPLNLQAYEIFVEQAKEAMDLRESEIAAKKRWVPWSVYAMPELSRVVAIGRIGYGSTVALEKVFREHPTLKLLELHSPGGLVSEEHQLELLVQRLHLDTVVLRECYSACTTVFLAGERRFVGEEAEFGFHQSGYKGKPRTEKWTVNESMQAIFFREKGVDSEFSRIALNTPYHEMWTPGPLALKDAGYATDWWSSRGPEYR